MNKFYSHGKLLLTGEYAVLDGVKALAVPTKKGQSLCVTPTSTGHIEWKSFGHDEGLWMEAIFDEKGKCIAPKRTPKHYIERLEQILGVIHSYAPASLGKGVRIETFLEFPQQWGLGSSSTLISNLSQWTKINPYLLLEKTFGGSGYDIAAAQHDSAIFYQRNFHAPRVETVRFSPPFQAQLFFVYLNQKQNSRNAIADYRQSSATIDKENSFARIADLGTQLPKITDQKTFNACLKAHEACVGELIGQRPIQERLFADFDGQLKSLGAWGGDFILASGNAETPAYFSKKGFSTIFSFADFLWSKKNPLQN